MSAPSADRLRVLNADLSMSHKDSSEKEYQE